MRFEVGESNITKSRVIAFKEYTRIYTPHQDKSLVAELLVLKARKRGITDVLRQ